MFSCHCMASRILRASTDKAISNLEDIIVTELTKKNYFHNLLDNVKGLKNNVKGKIDSSTKR